MATDTVDDGRRPLSSSSPAHGSHLVAGMEHISPCWLVARISNGFRIGDEADHSGESTPGSIGHDSKDLEAHGRGIRSEGSSYGRV